MVGTAYNTSYFLMAFQHVQLGGKKILFFLEKKRGGNQGRRKRKLQSTKSPVFNENANAYYIQKSTIQLKTFFGKRNQTAMYSAGLDDTDQKKNNKINILN